MALRAATPLLRDCFRSGARRLALTPFRVVASRSRTADPAPHLACGGDRLCCAVLPPPPRGVARNVMRNVVIDRDRLLKEPMMSNVLYILIMYKRFLPREPTTIDDTS